ncbi:hypothetical protein ACFSTC_29805 [Nonomuraea ferruginea]
MGERPGRRLVGLCQRYGRRFGHADPDRQEPLPVCLLEQNDRLIGGHFYPNAHYLHLQHGLLHIRLAGGPAQVIAGPLLHFNVTPAEP